MSCLLTDGNTIGFPRSGKDEGNVVFVFLCCYETGPVLPASPGQSRKLTCNLPTHLGFLCQPGVYYLTSKRPACSGIHFGLALPNLQTHLSPLV